MRAYLVIRINGIRKVGALSHLFSCILNILRIDRDHRAALTNPQLTIHTNTNPSAPEYSRM